MHKYSGTMGFQRLIKAVKNTGTPGADSVGTSQITNGSITTADIADEAITQAKFAPAVQLALAQFSQQLYNLQYPGFWGTIKFQNDNSSDGGAEMTITVEKRYYNQAEDTTETQQLLSSTTITKGNHYTISIPIGSRLINDVTKIRMYYTINKAQIEVNTSEIFQEDDKSSDENGDYFDFIFDGGYDENNGGDAEISFNIADNI
jgi:hypothetical protein